MQEIVEAIKNANFVYICGNGGSASTANHFANDLVKMCGVKAISLCANEAIVMAYANDNGYESIFEDQLDIFWGKDDLLITISGSGTSGNIVNAQKYVKEWREGECRSFPTMKEMNCDMQEAEDRHLQLVHSICKELCKEE